MPDLSKKTLIMTQTMTWTLLTALATAAVSILLHFYLQDKSNTEEIVQSASIHLKSSIECTGDSMVSRTCVIHNVCYMQDKEGAVLLISTDNDIKTGPLTYMHTVDQFPQDVLHLQKVDPTFLSKQTFISEDSYIFKRFKPDNLMHVLHDDVIPVYLELTKLYGSLQEFPVKFHFTDQYEVMPYDDFYTSLSSYGLAYRVGHNPPKLTCFRKAIVGSSRKTLWYDYGFHEPQGSVFSSDPQIVQDISELYKAKFTKNYVPTPDRSLNSIVLFTRLQTRLIINEQELVLTLAKYFHARVRTVSLETHSISELAQVLTSANTMIAMHGASLALQIFLPRHSRVLELFPLGINSSGYTPYRKLASLLDIQYSAWENYQPEHSIGHPEYPSEYGGLAHLPAHEREAIISSHWVEPHLCCDDPSWLYHIYQDTIVNIDELITSLEALIQS